MENQEIQENQEEDFSEATDPLQKQKKERQRQNPAGIRYTGDTLPRIERATGQPCPLPLPCHA